MIRMSPMPRAIENINAPPSQGSPLRMAILRIEINKGDTQAPTISADTAPRINIIKGEPPNPRLLLLKRD